MRVLYFSLIIIALACAGCRENYEPDIKSLEESFLVVEGNLNPAHDSTIVRLTRTFKIDDTAKIRVENNANLSVEGRDNSLRNLIYAGNGKYVSPDLNLIIGNEYRLRIKLTNGREYVSDYVKAKPTPAIDSIGWDMDGNDVQVYVNTSDPTGSSRYYRWTYDETWEIHSYFFSRLIYTNGVVRERVLPAEDIYTCWRKSSNSEILIANSTRLQDDIIYKKPLTLIVSGDDRLQVRYSILVKQYVLDKEAYNFYEIMKKNTEEIGSFFAPQPSEIKGNIHSVSDNTEPVIGYITASEERSKRIFIIIPTWRYLFDCTTIFVPADNQDSIKFYLGTLGLIPYDVDTLPPPPPKYLASVPKCADCRSRNATTVRPSFW